MDVIPVLGSAAVVGSLLVLWWAISGRKEAPVDLSTGDRLPGDLRDRRLLEPVGERAVQPVLERVGARLRASMPSARVNALSKKIQRAGSPEGWTVERVLAAKVLGALVLGALLGVRFLGSPSAGAFLLVVLGAFIGWFLPTGLLDSKVTRRKDELRRQIADVIDQLAVMVRAGLSIDAAIVRSTRTGQGAMFDELRRVVQEMRVGVSRRTALANMAERSDVPELRAVVAALSQADKLGVPVADTLRVQATELRIKRRQYAEEQAMKLPVKILFPMVVCILPVIFIVLLGPAAIRIFEQFGG